MADVPFNDQCCASYDAGSDVRILFCMLPADHDQFHWDSTDKIAWITAQIPMKEPPGDG